jgi:hypothetical protein
MLASALVSSVPFLASSETSGSVGVFNVFAKREKAEVRGVPFASNIGIDDLTNYIQTVRHVADCIDLLRRNPFIAIYVGRDWRVWGYDHLAGVFLASRAPLRNGVSDRGGVATEYRGGDLRVPSRSFSAIEQFDTNDGTFVNKNRLRQPRPLDCEPSTLVQFRRVFRMLDTLLSGFCCDGSSLCRFPHLDKLFPEDLGLSAVDAGLDKNQSESKNASNGWNNELPHKAGHAESRHYPLKAGVFLGCILASISGIVSIGYGCAWLMQLGTRGRGFAAILIGGVTLWGTAVLCIHVLMP